MAFLKNVIGISLGYFIIGLLLLLYFGKEMKVSMLGLQALTFGIIVAGYNATNLNLRKKIVLEEQEKVN